MTVDALLDTLVEATGLKAVSRAGWVRAEVPHPEDVAAHSWGVAWLVLMLLPPTLDRGRALAYAVLHDLPEVRVGDLTPHDGVSVADKHQREADALDALLWAQPSLATTWHAYEAQQDDEARFVRELDRLEMAIQALAYAEAGAVDMEAFVDSAARVISHPSLVPLLHAVRARLACLDR